TAPRAHHHFTAFLALQIAPERLGEEREIAFEIVQPDADDLVHFIADGPAVRIFLEPLSPEKVQSDLDQIGGAVGEIDHEQLARSQEPPVMILDSENVELLVIGIPVGTNATEAAGAVIKGVVTDADS